jgi:hypothetical protein
MSSSKSKSEIRDNINIILSSKKKRENEFELPEDIDDCLEKYGLLNCFTLMEENFMEEIDKIKGTVAMTLDDIEISIRKSNRDIKVKNGGDINIKVINVDDTDIIPDHRPPESESEDTETVEEKKPSLEDLVEEAVVEIVDKADVITKPILNNSQMENIRTLIDSRKIMTTSVDIISIFGCVSFLKYPRKPKEHATTRDKYAIQCFKEFYGLGGTVFSQQIKEYPGFAFEQEISGFIEFFNIDLHLYQYNRATKKYIPEKTYINPHPNENIENLNLLRFEVSDDLGIYYWINDHINIDGVSSEPLIKSTPKQKKEKEKDNNNNNVFFPKSKQTYTPKKKND